MGKRFKFIGEKPVQAKELDLLGAVPASCHLAKVVHLPFCRSLAKVFGIAEKSEVCLSKKRREYSKGEKKNQPWGSPCQRRSEGQCCNDLLDQPSHLLNHHESICGLNARTLKAVIEERVLVGREIQPGGLFHHPDADILRIAVGQQRIGVVDRMNQQAKDNIQPDLCPHQRPEVM